MSAPPDGRTLPSRSWPVSVRVPIVVALLMVAISFAVSNRVLTRLETTQERNLNLLASAYLDGLSASLVPSVVREDVWEVFDILDRSRERYRGLNVQWAVVTNSENRTIAASAPDIFPPLEALPVQTAAEFSLVEEVVTDEPSKQARMLRSLVYQDREIGRIYALVDISALMQERGEVLRELVLTNVLLTLLLTAFGYFYMRRMVRPVGVLSRYLIQSREGEMIPIPDNILRAQGSEFRDLFARYNAMTQAVNERELLAAELAQEEKLASVGRLASGMAHEINNPLGGMFNALDSLKKYGTRDVVRTTSIRLLEQGLTGIRDLVRSTLTTYRTDQRPRDLTPMDLDDLRLLLKPEARQKKQRLNFRVDFEGTVQVPAVAVRDAVFNLLLNACHSSPDNSAVGLFSTVQHGSFLAEISDEGGGLPPHMKEYLERAGAGSAPLDRRSGLGLWIVKRHCDELKAKLEVVKSGKGGTTIRFTVPISSDELEHAA